ncbi:UNVERIFIED_CONTAM: hypothetical protein ITH36_25245, partial [Salmonella enterica subsp. enterica serovar Weltevreden]
QSPRAWFGRFSKAMTFLKYTGPGQMAILLVYVDDIIVTGNDQKEIQALKQYLFKEFDIKDLGRLKYFLGIEVVYSNKGIFISQHLGVNLLT